MPDLQNCPDPSGTLTPAGHAAGMKTPHIPPYPKRPHASGQARVKVKGRQVYLGVWGSPQSRTAYARLVASLAAGNADVPPPPKSAAVTVAEVVARFLRHAEADYDPAGRELENFRHSLRPLLDLHGTEPAHAFGPKKLKALQLHMARTLGWCRNTANRRVTRVKTAWKWAESEELVPPGSYAALRTVRGLKKSTPGVRSTPRRRGCTRQQLDAVTPFCPKPVAAMLELQFVAGLRSQEVRLMREDCIDRTGDVWIYTPPRDKNEWRDGAEEAPRVAAFGPAAQQILAPWLRQAGPGAYLFRPTNRCRRCRDHYSSNTYAQAVRRACVRATAAPGGAEPRAVRERHALLKEVRFVPYQGRHAMKRRVTKELGLDAARAALGQHSLGTTAGYDHHQDVQHAAEVARKLG